MNLRSLEYFLIAAEELNFTKASERLFITQQALSSHIKRLEDEYNVKLFERRPSLHLTLEGGQMVFYAKLILDSEAKLRAAFSDISRNCRGILRIGISRLRANVFFPRFWERYHPFYPNISVELVDGNSDRLDDLLKSGKIDLYIGVDVPTSPNQFSVELAREKIHCYMARSILEKYRPEQSGELINRFSSQGADLTEIIDLPLVTLRTSNRLRKSLELFFSRQLIKPNYIFECEQQDLIYTLARSGDGIGLMSPIIFYQKMREISELSGEFYVFPVMNNIPENIVHLVYRSDSPQPKYLVGMINVIREVFGEYASTIEK